MRITSLLRRSLGFVRLSVLKVDFDESGSLIVQVRPRGRPRCPQCGRKCPIEETRGPRRWRHLDVFHRTCYLESPVRRVRCRRCQRVLTERVSWAEPNSGFTTPFEDEVAWLAQRLDKTSISTYLRIAWRTVGRILESAVDRHKAPVDLAQLRAIGVDEIAYRKGHRYLTLVTDHDTGRIIWSGEGRSTNTLLAFFKEIGKEACARVEVVTLDMCQAYIKAVEDRLPNAQIVYDRFHVQGLVSAALDETRREEWRRLRATAEASSIKHMRWAVLKNPWNLTEKQDEALADLPAKNMRLYRGYLLKEAFADIFRRYKSRFWARLRLVEWLAWACRSRLPAFVKAARTIRHHFDGVLRYFGERLTNSLAEGINTKARLATRQAYGFHSVTAVQAMIELRCGGVVIPLPHPC